jgi:hypothetical protein
MTDYRMFDVTRADGCYIKLERVTLDDDDASPNDYLFQDDDYKEQDQARLDAFRSGDWTFIGIQAVAHIEIVRNGTATLYTLSSPGLWAIESDSSEDYLNEVFEDECNALKADIAAFGNATYA